jgi:hypothetical protein
VEFDPEYCQTIIDRFEKLSGIKADGMSRRQTIDYCVRISSKIAFLEQLKRTPTIETSCQKVGVARATVYRWMTDSNKFKAQVEDSPY